MSDFCQFCQEDAGVLECAGCYEALRWAYVERGREVDALNAELAILRGALDAFLAMPEAETNENATAGGS